VTHKGYELAKPSLIRVRADGRRDYFVELEPAVIRVIAGSVDTLVTDRDGNVIADSRKERADRKKSIAERISAHSGDAVLSLMLSSYDNAVRDADNELVHLYEIRDALAKHFGSETQARQALGIPKSSWSRLGQLCNDAPLRQGRHRGKTGAAQRDATDSELEEARSMARSMIDAYLTKLEGTTDC
jgi:hypothetical protein